MFLDSLFEKRITIYKKKDSATWKQIRKVLKDAGLKGVRAGHYLQDAVMAGGCGAKLDPRDFGPNGRIDREIYWIDVVQSREAEAREIIRRAGLVAEVEDNVLLDAALRKKPKPDNEF